MAVFQVKKYKIKKDENGNEIQVQKSKEEYNKETKNGKCTWYFKVYKKDIKGVNKAYKSKKYSTRKEAQEEEALFILKRDNPTNKPFELVAKDYFNEIYTIKKESSANSYESVYNKHIKVYFQNYYINKINVTMINEWKQELLQKKLGISYLNKIYAVLKKIFDFAMRNYGLEFNPVVVCGRFQQKKDIVVKDEDKIRYITYEQFTQFISVIDDIMWKTFFMFLYYTGMRKGEVIALTWRDIDFNHELIVVNKTLYSKIKGKYTITSTKNNLNRKIKMSKTLLSQLANYKNEIMKYTDFSEDWYVFGCSRFLPLTNIDRYKQYYFELSGVPPITIHEFRHSHVSLLINEYIKTSKEKNMKVDTAKFFLMMSSRMGHTIDVMQKTYMHLFDSVQDEIVDLLNNL